MYHHGTRAQGATLLINDTGNNESCLISVGEYTDESSLEYRTLCSKNNNDGLGKTPGGNTPPQKLEAMAELGAESSHAISGDEMSGPCRYQRPQWDGVY